MGPVLVLKGDAGNKLAICAAPIGIALTVVPMIFVLRPTATPVGRYWAACDFAYLRLLMMLFVFDGLQGSGLFG